MIHIVGTPGAISTKLGICIAIYVCNNLMYVLYIFRREDGVGGREFG
jgi:pyrrolidone-carboxylate peptidase